MEYEIPYEILTAVQLQDKLESLTVENAKEVADFIIKSEFFADERLNSTTDFILSYCINWPKRTKAFAELYKYLIKEKKDVAIIITYTSIFRGEYRLPQVLFKEGVIPIQMFVKAADEVQKPDSLFWIAPELASIPELNLGFSSFIPVEPEVYKANDWKVYREFVDSSFLPNTYGYALYHDDVEMLKDVMTREGFHIDSPLIYIYGKRLPVVYNPQPIDLAAFFASKQCFKYLKQNKAKIDEKTILMAIAGGDMEIVMSLQSVIEKIENCMLVATKYHNTAAIDWLISKGCPPPVIFHAIDSYNFRALNVALQKGADPAARDDHAITAVRLAAQGGVPGALELLLNKGGKAGIEEFSLACCNDDRCYLVPLLIKHGIDPKMKSDEGVPLLVDSLGNNCLQSAREILKNGGDANATLPNGVSILAIAAQNDAVDAVKLLLEFHADINKQNPDGTYPIHFARTKEVLSVMLDHGANIDAKDKMGGTPLFFAVAEKRTEAVKFLLEKGANTNITVGPAKITLLQAAKKVGAADIEKILKSYKK